MPSTAPTSATTAPTVSLSGKDAVSLKATALVLGVEQTEDGPRLLAGSGIPAGATGELTRALTVLGLSGKAEEVAKIPAPQEFSVKLVVLAGVGAKADDAEAVRRAVGAAVRLLAGSEHVAIDFPTADPAWLAAVAEGALLGAYGYTEYRTQSPASARVPSEITICTPWHRDKQARATLERARVLAEAVNNTRDLVNCPPNDLFPARFADLAVAAGKEYGFSVAVTDDKALKAGGYGGLTGVGQGSTRPPRLVKLTYTPKGRGKTRLPHVALVGKGITFDSGGLSIKPATAMTTMKLDMAGAAAVLNTVVAAARLQLPIKVTGWLCLAENMPSAAAQRPSDVITIFGGKTVEVLNTDAEGRLVLADGIVSASNDQPDAILDIATLTGAQMVALGNRVSAVMANNDQLREEIVSAATTSGEQFWPMPLPAELRPSLDSTVADLANIGDRMGGMLTAGLFLAEFVGTGADGEKLPWAHLDIAGPSFNEGGPHGYTGKGGTGVGVRTMLTLLESRAGEQTRPNTRRG